MAYSKQYSKEEIKAFRIKDVYGLTQTLISAYSRLQEGSGKEIDLAWVKKTLKKVMNMAEDIVDENMKKEEERKKKEWEEAGKKPPFEG